MGRSSVSGLTVTVFGATGFVGRYLVNRLGQIGTQVVVPFRGNEYDMLHLRQMGDVGQIVPIRFHLRDQASIYNAVKDSHVVINLIGQDRRTFHFTPEQVNCQGALSIAEACREAEVPRLIHVSSLMSRMDSRSAFLRSKASGERELRDRYPRTVIARPSTLYGHEDRFLNGIALFAAFPLGYPVIKGGHQIRHPLYVGDLCEGLWRLCQAEKADGQTFDLVGPEPRTILQVTQHVAAQIMRPHHPIVSVPPLALWAWSKIFPEWRRPIYTLDLVKALEEDETCDGRNLGFADLGMRELQKMNDLSIQFLRIYRRATDVGNLSVDSK